MHSCFVDRTPDCVCHFQPTNGRRAVIRSSYSGTKYCSSVNDVRVGRPDHNIVSIIFALSTQFDFVQCSVCPSRRIHVNKRRDIFTSHKAVKFLPLFLDTKYPMWTTRWWRFAANVQYTDPLKFQFTFLLFIFSYDFIYLHLPIFSRWMYKYLIITGRVFCIFSLSFRYEVRVTFDFSVSASKFHTIP